jgi:hypothetical protein
VCRRPIDNDPAPVVGFLPFEVLARGAFPRVKLGMVGESGDLELFREAVRLARNQFKNDSNSDEKERVSRDHQNIGMHAMNHDSLVPASTTSVKRVSLGSSSVTGGAECRIPNQAR